MEADLISNPCNTMPAELLLAVNKIELNFAFAKNSLVLLFYEFLAQSHQLKICQRLKNIKS